MCFLPTGCIYGDYIYPVGTTGIPKIGSTCNTCTCTAGGVVQCTSDNCGKTFCMIALYIITCTCFNGHILFSQEKTNIAFYTFEKKKQDTRVNT